MPAARDHIDDSTPASQRRSVALLRLEDVALAGWVALAAPLLYRQDATSLFESNQPARGVLYTLAVFSALVSVAARRRPNGTQPRAIINTGYVGPFVGGLLLLAISSAVALNATTAAVVALAVVAIVISAAVRAFAPPLATTVRRALLTPFILATGGAFWAAIDSLLGPSSTTATVWRSSPQAIGFFLAFSAVFYAMLVFAPRQLAEREGHLWSWVLRYIAFAGAALLGFSWQRLLGLAT